jgi:hypothetical protein
MPVNWPRFARGLSNIGHIGGTNVSLGQLTPVANEEETGITLRAQWKGEFC